MTDRLLAFREFWEFLQRENLLRLLGVVVALIAGGAAGLAYFEEDQSLPDALWWAVVTLTTVGYGDVYPQTTGGKIFTGLILLIGLGVIAIPSGLIASGMTKVKKKRD